MIKWSQTFSLSTKLIHGAEEVEQKAKISHDLMLGTRARYLLRLFFLQSIEFQLENMLSARTFNNHSVIMYTLLWLLNVHFPKFIFFL